MITLTENAVKKVEEFFNQDPQIKGKSLRIYVEAGGCSGYQYGFTFDEKKEGDAEVPYNGFSLLIDPQSVPFLSGCQVDYKEDFGGSGFSITNPNAKKSCGCGHSFEA